jgi:hypothetical protein
LTYLDPVVAEFIAQVSRYVDPVNKMTVAAEAAAKANGNLGDKVTDLNATLAAFDLNAATVKLADLTSAAKDTRTAFLATSTASGGLQKSLGNLGDRITKTIGGLMLLDVELDKKAAALVKAGVSAATLATAVGMINTKLGVNTAANAANNAAQARTVGWFRLTANAIHWIVMGTLEIAATAVPALVALTAAVLQMFPAFSGIGDRMHWLLIATGGVDNMMAQSVPQLRRMSAGMATLQSNVQPDAWIIFGSVIQMVTSKMGLFHTMAQGASNVLAQFSVRLASDLQTSGGLVQDFFSGGVKYMIQWGQVLGNLGVTFAHVITSMWGVGQLLLDFLVGLTRLLADLTSMGWVQALIGGAAAFSALYRYGKLVLWIFNAIKGSAIIGWFITLAQEIRVAVAATAALGLGLRTTTVALTVIRAQLLALATSYAPILIATAVLAGAILVWRLATLHTADATSQLIAKINAMPPSVGNLAAGISQMITVMLFASKSAAGLTQKLKDLRGATHAPSTAGSSLQMYIHDFGAAAAETRKLYDSLKALDIGLFQTTAGLGTVAAYTTFLNIQDALNVSQVEKMNQAYAEFMANVTGGTGGLAAFAESIANIGQVAGSTAENLGKSTAKMNLSASEFATALTQGPIKAAGAWTNFDQVIGQTMPQLVSWLNIARTEGTLTGVQYSKAILDMASAMTVYARKSPVARAELLAFAQAQGLNIKTFPELMKAIRDTGARFGDLTKLVGASTKAMSDAEKVAEDMNGEFKSQVEATLEATALKVSGFNTDVANMLRAQQTGLPVAGHAWQYWATLALNAADQARQHIAGDTTAVLNLGSAIRNVPRTWSTTYTLIYRQSGQLTGPGGDVGPGTPGHNPGAMVNPGRATTIRLSQATAPQITVHVHGSVLTTQELARTVQEAMLTRALNQPQYGAAWPGRRH